MTFYSSEEVIIAYNEKRVDLARMIKVRVDNELKRNDELTTKTY